MEVPEKGPDDQMRREQLWDRGIIPVVGVINESFYFNVLDPLEKLINGDNKELEEIHIRFNSIGGDPSWIAPFIHLVSKSRIPVVGIIYEAMSTAFVMAVACHYRMCYPTSVMMHHKTELSISGKVTDVSSYSRVLGDSDVKYDDFIIQRTDISRKLMNEKKDSEWWITAANAKKLGVVHEVLNLRYYLKNK